MADADELDPLQSGIREEPKADGPETALDVKTERDRPNMPPTRGLLMILVVIAILAVLYAARAVIAPIVVALLLSFLFKPLLRRMSAIHIPDFASALLVVLVVFVLITGPILAVMQSMAGWVEDASTYAEQIETKLTRLQEAASEVTDDLDTATGSEGVEDAGPAADDDGALTVKSKELPPKTAKSRDKGDDTSQASRSRQAIAWVTSNSLGPLMAQTRDTIATILFTLLLLFFLLASGDTYLRRVVMLLPDFHQKRNVVEMIYEIEASISAYLITLTMINTVFGVVAGTLFWLMGVPNPILWGLGAALCNFVPYLGPIVYWLIFTPFCLLVFDRPIDAVWPSLAFIGMNLLEGYIISPHIYGKRMALHPLVVFVGIAVFGWLWGVMGALLAVPIVVCINVVCRHFDVLRPYAVLLSGEDEPLQVKTQPAIAGEGVAAPMASAPAGS